MKKGFYKYANELWIMDTLNKYQQELNKLLYLKNRKPEKFRFSTILLFREYQTRLFTWKKALNLDNLSMFNRDKQFHNLFIDLAPDWLEELITEQKVVEDLKSEGFDYVKFTHRHYDGFFVSMFLNWELFKDKPEIQLYSILPHPYEPVCKIFSRGGTIANIHSAFEIDRDETYRKHNNNFKLPSLNDDFLTYIDHHVTDFPNQELVNQLWEKFRRMNPNALY
ncbi:hypothetical protein [Pedobacter caeni]|uniref:Uncharacterized protein n=1 Tax=Pedobacter caeni TaxID=288992 RepID=A0A1M4TV20_9SPHI|nr:hypothetical protein [Pedobacter caeni]SHE48329.1 hypothetical protein SAMN04488522_101331 [Pedobacter caeni]